MNIIGNEKFVSHIGGMFESGRLLHACVISGPRGSGKKTLARYLAAAAVCTGEKPPCGKCEGCVKADKDIHPDIETVKREQGKTQVAVDQIRALRRSLFTRANEAPRKVAIVEEAGMMNDSAQNAFLKVLEEPPASVLLILLAENEADLLPTIRSRCALFRTEPLKEEQIIRELKKRDPGISDEDAETAANMAGGSLGRALEHLGMGDRGKTAAEIIRAIASGSGEKIIMSVLPMEKMKREQITEELAEIRRFLAGAAAVINKKRGYYPLEEERLLAEKLGVREMIRLNAGCEKLIQYCQANVGAGHITGALISMFTEVCK